MKNLKKIFIIWMILLLSVSSTSALNLINQNINQNADISIIQEGTYIKKLQWFSPNGELPGTYEEYIKNHPLQPA